MRQNTLARRLDLLKLEGDGLFQPEIVKQLSKQHACTPRTVYYDFQTKPKWQPYIQELIHVYLRIINRHDQLYRRASLQYLQASTVKEKLMAINLMRSINSDLYEFAKGTGYRPEEVKSLESRELKWVDPPEWRHSKYSYWIDQTEFENFEKLHPELAKNFKKGEKREDKDYIYRRTKKSGRVERKAKVDYGEQWQIPMENTKQFGHDDFKPHWKHDFRKHWNRNLNQKKIGDF